MIFLAFLLVAGAAAIWSTRMIWQIKQHFLPDRAEEQQKIVDLLLEKLEELPEKFTIVPFCLEIREPLRILSDLHSTIELKLKKGEFQICLLTLEITVVGRNFWILAFEDLENGVIKIYDISDDIAVACYTVDECWALINNTIQARINVHTAVQESNVDVVEEMGAGSSDDLINEGLQ